MLSAEARAEASEPLVYATVNGASFLCAILISESGTMDCELELDELEAADAEAEVEVVLHEDDEAEDATIAAVLILFTQSRAS